MLVGHNPTLTQFVNMFSGNPLDSLPTSGIVCISFQTDKWTEISFAAARKNFTIFPKAI
jgi:phosphohistidine phosphatase